MQLPPSAHTFRATDFGAYTPRGYNTCGIAGRISGIPISYLHTGQWLKASSERTSGTLFEIYDSANRLLGTIYKPSGFAPGDLLHFHPTVND